jgi:hypothetical protein
MDTHQIFLYTQWYHGRISRPGNFLSRKKILWIFELGGSISRNIRKDIFNQNRLIISNPIEWTIQHPGQIIL